VGVPLARPRRPLGQPMLTATMARPSQGAMVSATDIIRGVRPWLDLPVLSVSRAAIRSPRRPWKRSSATSWSARPRWLASFLLRGQRRRQPPHAALPVAESCSRPPSWAKSKRPPVTHVAATLRRHSPVDAPPGPVTRPSPAAALRRSDTQRRAMLERGGRKGEQPRARGVPTPRIVLLSYLAGRSLGTSHCVIVLFSSCEENRCYLNCYQS